MGGTPGASSGCISLKRSVVVGAILDFVTSIHFKCYDNFVNRSQGCERPYLIDFALFPRLNSLLSAPPTTTKAGS